MAFWLVSPRTSWWNCGKHIGHTHNNNNQLKREAERERKKETQFVTTRGPTYPPTVPDLLRGSGWSHFIRGPASVAHHDTLIIQYIVSISTVVVRVGYIITELSTRMLSFEQHEYKNN